MLFERSCIFVWGGLVLNTTTTNKSNIFYARCFQITCGTRIRFTRDDTHHHPGAYFQRRVKTKTSERRGESLSASARARFVSLFSFVERESDFSPTNQPKYSFMRYFFQSSCGGKKEQHHPPLHNQQQQQQQRFKPVLLFAPPKTALSKKKKRGREKETFARRHRSIARKGVGFPCVLSSFVR